ncbi:MAG: SPFH domain-containing protein [Coriobacteriia bacterium]|nr:SPFH domain-containing protein [Coriobacteriia bacterium]
MVGTTSLDQKALQVDEIIPRAMSGMGVLIVNTVLMIVSCVGAVYGFILIDAAQGTALALPLIVVTLLYLCLIGPLLYGGLKVLRPNEALVLTLFGKYYGTLKEDGFFFVNPFTSAINPANGGILQTSPSTSTEDASLKMLGIPGGRVNAVNKKISLKTMTLNNQELKINDLLGNPIMIGIVVIWRVVNTAKAAFNVDNYEEFLSIQCDSALRNIVRLYPYDVSGDDHEKTLRASSQEIAQKIKEEIQSKVDVAGLEIIESRITHLSYAPEIAAAMLQRQQASAIIDARQMIVEGAVGMVEMALKSLNEGGVVNLDEERKAAMVSNLLVVLCGNRDVQPIVNSGSIY